MRDDHVFTCKSQWLGGRRGGTTGYASYSREMRVEVENKPALLMSAAPAFRGDASLHNPEDLLVMALSTCHALSYLALASLEGLVVVGYEDVATGRMTRIGKTMAFASVHLQPVVTLAKSSSKPSLERALALHESAHQECFIANSVSFPITFEGIIKPLHD